MKNMTESIEAIENALTFLEALGYKEGGDIHDDLAGALTYLKARKAKREEAERIAQEWSRGVHASFKLPK